MGYEHTPGETALSNVEPIISPELGDLPKDKCGVFGIYAPGMPVVRLTYEGLEGLQQRGQGGAGLAYPVNTRAGSMLVVNKGLGLVPQALGLVVSPNQRGGSVIDDSYHPALAIGQVRYPTAGSETFDAAQPFRRERIAVAQNGEIDNIRELAERFGVSADDALSDTSLLTDILAKRTEEADDMEVAAREVLQHANGGFCIVMTDGERVIGARDPWGFHPFAIGELPGGGHVLASESVVFRGLGARFTRDVERGEIVSLGKNGLKSSRIDRVEPQLECKFEYIYTARPDGVINGVSVSRARRLMGRYLAIDHPIPTEPGDNRPLIVVGVPTSGLLGAEGYARESGIPVVMAVHKNPYAARMFIQSDSQRQASIGGKYWPDRLEIAGNRLGVLDDSIVRADTLAALLAQLDEAGAAEMHVRSTADEYIDSCHMGMATHNRSKLVARGRNNQEILDELRRLSGVGRKLVSVAFNSRDRIEQAIDEAVVDPTARAIGRRLCHSCTTGDYPFPLSRGSGSVPLPMPSIRDGNMARI